MLTAATEIPRDQSVPALEPCMDPSEVLSACKRDLTRVAADVRESWSQIHMIEAMYHPQRYVRVVYAISADPSIPANRVWPEGEIVYLHAPVRMPMSRRGAILRLGGTEVEAYTFPNDRRLRGLRSFAGRGSCVDTWQHWLASNHGSAEIDASTLQRLLVRYVPEQKWVVRLRAEIQGGASQEKRKQRIAVRATTQSYCERLRDRHSALAQGLADPSVQFVFPDVIGCEPSRGLLGIEWLRGQSLVEAIQECGPDDIMRGFARRLKSLHETSVEGLDAVGLPEIALRIDTAVRDLKATCPALEPDLMRLEAVLEQRLAACAPLRRATLHNDLHWNQLSIKRNRFALLDLDRMATGDPLVDVANFATELQMLGERPEFNLQPGETEGWSKAFLAAWREHDESSTNGALYPVCACLSRLELSRGMLRHLRPGWRDLARRCVEFSLRDLMDGANLQD